MSVKPESSEHLGEASLQPGLPVNEGEGEQLVVVGNPHVPPRRGSSFERERDVIPNDDETNEEFVFRILGDRILELAICDVPVGRFSPSRELALRYRLVCRGWRDTINSIYHTAVLPLFEYRGPSFFSVDLVKVERMMRNLRSLTSLFAGESDACSAVAPPVSLEFTLSCLPIPLETKIEFEATALNTLRQMGRLLLTLKLDLPHNSLEGMNCSSLDLQNLKHAEFTFYNPKTSTPNTLAHWKIVEAVLKAATSLQTLHIRNDLPHLSAEMPKLALSTSLERLRLDCIRIPVWLIDIAPTLKNMRQLVLIIGTERLSGQEPEGHMDNLLINKLSKYLELLELRPLADLSTLSEPIFSISEPMPKLQTLKLQLREWKLVELRSYRELLPSLIDLEVFAYSDKAHFPASWYASPCSTLRRLCLRIHGGPSEASQFSQQVLGRISRSFPNLNELDVDSDKCADNNWQPVLIQGLHSLRKLKMRCSNVSADGRNRLAAAVSGIPLEELQAIWEGGKELELAMNVYQHCWSLRDLEFLEELLLDAFMYGEDDENEDDQFRREETDSSVMIYSTFLRMPNLKKVALSSRFRLTDELKQHARKETGLDIN